MRETSEQRGSLKIEDYGWTYTDLAAKSRYSVSTLQKYVHWGLLRSGIEYWKRGGRLVFFHPEKTMTRLAWIGENLDVLREAKKEMAGRVASRRQAGHAVVRDRA